MPTVPVVRERAMVDGGDRACEETQTRSSCSLIANLQRHVDYIRLLALVYIGEENKRVWNGCGLSVSCLW